MSTITIVGAGRVGYAIGTAALRLGHTVRYAVREGSGHDLPDGASAVPVAGAAEGADLTILAVPASAVHKVVAELAPPAGSVLVDATNPFGAPLPEGHASSMSVVAATAGDAVRVVKAFNVLGFEHMADPPLPDGFRPVLPVAGDDPAARAAVARLATDMGYHAVQVGGSEAAPVLEAAAQYWGLLAFAGGLGRDMVLVAHQRTA